MKALYRVPESVLHWYLTYIEHPGQKPCLLQLHIEPCLLYKVEGNTLTAMAVPQVNDNLVVVLKSSLDHKTENVSLLH